MNGYNRVLMLVVLTLLAACGTPVAQPPAGTPMSEPAASPPAEATPSAAAAFPVTIEHKFGSTEIPTQPERVVTIGYSEQDPVLALGVIPIAVRDWFGDQPYAVWPWAQDELGDARPAVLKMPFGELSFETIAALRPDLIIGTHSGITQEEYETLAQIAPTVAQPGEYPDFGVPWQEQTRVIGRALGREQRAAELVAEVEAAIAAARDAHPEFEGKTIAYSHRTGDGQYWSVGPTTPPMRFFQSLGLAMPTELARVVGDRDSAQISTEQLGLLDADALIFFVATPEERTVVENDPLFRQLDAVRDGRVIFFVGLDDPVYGALAFSTVLSLPFAIDGLVPKLAAAIDGTPRSTTP